MLRSLLPLLACPNCRSEIRIVDERVADELSVMLGNLACMSCGAGFPIAEGIPRLMPQNLLAAQQDEVQARDSQVRQYDRNTFLNLFGQIEIPKTLAALVAKSSDLALEAGCGTGRMTSILSRRVRELVSVDFSFESLLANQTKLAASGITNVHLAQGDICNLPFAPETFECGVSCQVLEHVPGDAARKAAVASIARVMQPGAPVVVSAYQYSPLMGAKEGCHDGGIPFFRFARQEFRDLLGTQFDVCSVTGSLVYLYLAKCRTPYPSKLKARELA